jgi:hypothetical protein
LSDGNWRKWYVPVGVVHLQISWHLKISVLAVAKGNMNKIHRLKNGCLPRFSGINSLNKKRNQSTLTCKHSRNYRLITMPDRLENQSRTSNEHH